MHNTSAFYIQFFFLLTRSIHTYLVNMCKLSCHTVQHPLFLWICSQGSQVLRRLLEGAMIRQFCTVPSLCFLDHLDGVSNNMSSFWHIYWVLETRYLCVEHLLLTAGPTSVRRSQHWLSRHNGFWRSQPCCCETLHKIELMPTLKIRRLKSKLPWPLM